MVGQVIWYLFLVIFGIALISAVLMVVSPPRYRRFSAWYSRNPRFSEPAKSNRRTRWGGVATLLWWGLMIGSMYIPSLGQWPHWGLTFGIGFLGLGLAGILKPTIFSSWIESSIHDNPEVRRLGPEKLARGMAAVLALGGVLFLGIILWNHFGLPVTFPFGRPDFPLLLGGLLCLYGAIYTAVRPERALTYLQKPVNPWVVKLIVALQVLTGVAMLLAFIQNANPMP